MFVPPLTDPIPLRKVPGPYRHLFVAKMPAGARVIAGPYTERHTWMLHNHCDDMQRAGRKFGIAPDGTGLSTFTL
jgi:hypothetical protein